VIAVLRATNWSKRVGPGRILTTEQIDRKIRHSAAKSHVSIMKYTYSVEYWCLSILPLWSAEYEINEKIKKKNQKTPWPGRFFIELSYNES
jgi:hypothetical protein